MPDPAQLDLSALPLPPRELLMLAFGVLLLVAGGRLYWLAVGGVGFLLGLAFARQALDLGPGGLELGIGFLLGLVGAVAAVLAQKVAVALAGLVVGGGGMIWLLGTLHVEAGVFAWVAVAAAAALGVLLAALLFQATLIVLSSVVGAALVTAGLGLTPPTEGWVLLLLVACGVVLQTGTRRRRRARGRAAA